MKYFGDSDSDTDGEEEVPIAHRAAAIGDVTRLAQVVQQDPSMLEMQNIAGEESERFEHIYNTNRMRVLSHSRIKNLRFKINKMCPVNQNFNILVVNKKKIRKIHHIKCCRMFENERKTYSDKMYSLLPPPVTQ